MKEIILLTLEYPPQIGGVARYLEAEVRSAGASVEIIRADDFFWRLWPKWLPLLWRLPKLMRREKCDYLWVSHLLPIGYAPLFLKIPFRLYLHGLDLVRPLKNPWKKFWAARILRRADELVANSRATAELLSNYGIAPDRVTIQYPRLAPINPDQYLSLGRRLREIHKIGGSPLLLTVSRLNQRKGIELVLRALPEIWQTVPDLVYVIVGEGEEREQLSVIASEASAERGNLNNTSSDDKIASPLGKLGARNDKVIFAGSVTDEIKFGWLSACDCFILTPIDDPNDFEGYGIVYKEAQMFGKPVIGSRVGGVPEAVGDDGILIEPGNVDAISKIVVSVFRGGLEFGNFRILEKKHPNSQILKFQTPKVSIIIPLYNQYKKLLVCLDSINKQTFADYEVIIVNDGSTDISQADLEKIVKCQLSNVNCFYQDNAGAPSARNRGFSESKGKYILFCDADVILKPTILAKMVKILDDNLDVSYVYSSFKFGWKKFKLWEFDADRLKQMPYIHTTSLVRREHFPGFDRNLKRLQDWDLWLTMLEQGHIGRWIPEVLFTVQPGGTISAWLPSLLAKTGIGNKAKEYRRAVKIIKNKHNLL